MTPGVIFAASILLAANLALAQDIVGSWIGTLPRPGGSTQRVVVNLTKGRQGDLKGILYDQRQGSASIPFSSLSFAGSTLTFTVASPSGPISFIGTLSEDRNSVQGFFQGLPVKLERVGKAKREVELTAAPLTAPAQSADQDSAALLSRALAKLAGTSQRLLKYSCLQTVERAYYNEPGAKKLGAHPMSEAPVQSCKVREFSKDGHLPLDTKDRVRLVVAESGGAEIDSWPTATRFDSRSVFEMIPNGPMSTGAFGPLVVGIFENAGSRYVFMSRKSEGTRVLFEYAFEVPVAASSTRVRAGLDWIKTGVHGYFDIDAATAELVHLVTETEPLPIATKACLYRTDSDYHYMQIGDGQFLMPIKYGFDVLYPDGNEARSVTTFSACHEYAAESSIVFDEKAAAPAVKATPKTAPPLPPGLSLTLAIVDAIDVRTAAAGDPVSARVTKAVRAPGSKEVLVDEGAVLHGRLTAMQHRYRSRQFAFSIRYETLEQRGAVSPVSVALDSELKAEARKKNALATRGTEFSLPAPPASGDTGGWFAVPATEGGYVIASGFVSKWTTR